jgi:hypothetical protein
MGTRSGRVGLVVLGCMLVLVGLGGYALAAGRGQPAGRRRCRLWVSSAQSGGRMRYHSAAQS